MHNDTEIHLTCSCQSHELHIEREIVPPFDKCDPMWYGSFWLRGYKDTGWKWRWRVLWHILKTGKPYGDEIVMTKENLQELSDYIQKQLEITDKNSS